MLALTRLSLCLYAIETCELPVDTCGVTIPMLTLHREKDPSVTPRLHSLSCTASGHVRVELGDRRRREGPVPVFPVVMEHLQNLSFCNTHDGGDVLANLATTMPRLQTMVLHNY